MKNRNFTKTLLWLDDARDPFSKKIDWLVFSPIGRNVDIVWLDNYQEFVDHIIIFGLPDGICFDHDLGSYKETGYDCAKWLVNYCLDNNKKLPKYNIQSANPVGKENIDRLLQNFKKFTEK